MKHTWLLPSSLKNRPMKEVATLLLNLVARSAAWFLMIASRLFFVGHKQLLFSAQRKCSSWIKEWRVTWDKEIITEPTIVDTSLRPPALHDYVSPNKPRETILINKNQGCTPTPFLAGVTEIGLCGSVIRVVGEAGWGTLKATATMWVGLVKKAKMCGCTLFRYEREIDGARLSIVWRGGS